MSELATVGPDGAEWRETQAGRTDELVLAADKRRLVVLGDPHGDLIALDVVLAREAGPETQIVSAGDNVGYADGTASSMLCRWLHESGVPSVRGNHEAWSAGGRLFLPGPGRTPHLQPEALAWCNGLPERIRVTFEDEPDLRISIVHALPGWGYADTRTAWRLIEHEGADLVFCGHSHRPAIYAVKPPAAGEEPRPRVRRLDPKGKTPEVSLPIFPGERAVIDAGSLARPSRPRGGMCPSKATYAVLDRDRRTLQVRCVDKTARARELAAGLLQKT